MIQKSFCIWPKAVESYPYRAVLLILAAFLVLGGLSRPAHSTADPANSALQTKQSGGIIFNAAAGEKYTQPISVFFPGFKSNNSILLAQSRKTPTIQSPNTIRTPNLQIDPQAIQKIPVAVVPDLRGLKFKAARKKVAKNKLAIKRVGKNYSNIKQGLIYHQEPRPNTRAPQGSTIQVWTSLGRLEAPNLIGKSVKKAQRSVNTQLKISVREIGQGYADLQRGLIYEQEPKPGAVIEPGTRINVRTSLGQLKAPNLIGKSLKNARQSVNTQLKISVREIGQDYADLQRGMIYEQEPKPGAVIEPGTRINVRTSLGQLRVPNLLGKTLKSAGQSLFPETNLMVEEAGRDYREEEQGLIFRQDPPPDAKLPDDRRIKVWLSRGPKPDIPKPVKIVPDLRGMTPVEAETRYQNLPLVANITERTSSQKEPDTIISQDPEPGATMPQDNRIDVRVSNGIPARVRVPDIRGLMPAEAESNYSDIQLIVEVTGKGHAEAPVNSIISQVPEPGSSMPVGGRINVRVSLGEILRTPDILGLTPAEAKTRYRNLELGLLIREYEESDKKAGTIIRQRPGAGIPMADNRQIEIWISESKALMPDLVGLTTGEAERMIKGLKLSIQVAGEENSSSRIETIIRQLPAPGASLPADQFINVWLSLGEMSESETTDYWQMIAVGGGAILIFGAMGLFVKIARKKRVGTSKSKPSPAPKTPSLKAKAKLDHGEQKVETDRSIIRSPAVSLRAQPDGGHQKIEYNQTPEKE